MNTKELCRHIGVTLRQVQWWCETGVLRCGYVGHFREFDEEQVAAAALVKELRRKGLPLQRVRKIMAGKPKGDFLVITRRSRLWCGREELIATVARAPGPCSVISLEDLRRVYG